MGRAPCCDKANVKRGPWSPEEDAALRNYLERHGTGGNWIALPQKAGLKRCGKSCRLRWLNYLRPDIKHGGFTEEEDNVICTLYRSLGSRWSVIASQLQCRTDNDVKNYWNTKLKKKVMIGAAAQANLTANASNTTRCAAPTHPPPPPPPPPLPLPPTSSLTYVMPMESSSFGVPRSFNIDQQPTNFNGSSANRYVMSPPAQENISAASSSLTVENSYGYMPWPDTSTGATCGGAGPGGDDGFMMDMCLEPSPDLLNWYGFQSRIGEATTSSSYNYDGSTPPNINSSLWSTVESKPSHGLYQSLTYL